MASDAVLVGWTSYLFRFESLGEERTDDLKKIKTERPSRRCTHTHTHIHKYTHYTHLLMNKSGSY